MLRRQRRGGGRIVAIKEPEAAVNPSTESSVAGQYYGEVQSVLCRIVKTQAAALRRAAELVAATIQRDGIVYSFGSGHSSVAGIELYFRGISGTVPS